MKFLRLLLLMFAVSQLVALQSATGWIRALYAFFAVWATVQLSWTREK